MSNFSLEEHLDSLGKFNYLKVEENSILVTLGATSHSNIPTSHNNIPTSHNNIPTSHSNVYEIFIILKDKDKPLILLPLYSHPLIKDNQITFDFNNLLGNILDEIYTKLLEIPPIPMTIDSLSHSQVKELLKDNDLGDFIHSTEAVSKSRDIQQSILVENSIQAGILGCNVLGKTIILDVLENNLTRSNQIKILKERIEKLQSINSSHRTTLDSLLYQQQQELIRFGSEYVTEQLRQMVATSDDMSELCASAFLEGKLTEEEFVKAFKESRKLYHLRNQRMA